MGLEKIYETKANAETNIFEKMNQQEALKDGKRLFVGIGNVSNPHNLHEFDAKAQTVESSNQTHFKDVS